MGRMGSNKVFAYTLKQMRGERGIKMLRFLEEYIDPQTNTDKQPQRLCKDKIQAKYLRIAQQFRVCIIKQFNTVFAGKHRRAFFGSWRGIKPDQSPRKLKYQCRCGLRAYPEPITQ